MVLGAVALAAGALIGTLMPGTDVEDSYMGETRDTVVDSAREMAEDNVEKLSQACAKRRRPSRRLPALRCHRLRRHASGNGDVPRPATHPHVPAAMRSDSKAIIQRWPRTSPAANPTSHHPARRQSR